MRPFKSLKSFFSNKKYIYILYLILAVVTAIKQYNHGSYNNYLIYKYTFFHAVEKLTLYGNYLAEYNDSNHYGILFSIIIAPFAILPDAVGTVLWNAANVALLIYAINKLPISDTKKAFICWITSNELITSLLSFQFNVGLAGIILLSFAYIERKKEIQSAFAIVIGTFIKLYGIVGLAFFFFIQNKKKFIIGVIIAAIILFLLPMAISSPDFVVNSYVEWYRSLAAKNAGNADLTSMQDISLMGMVRRVFHNPQISNLPFLLVGCLIFGLTYIRISQYKYLAYRLAILCSTLIFTVIFSSGSESPTYIIAFLGVAIWYFTLGEPKHDYRLYLFIFAILLTSLSPTDIFPRYVRDHYIIKYSLKALPCVIIWIDLIYQLLRRDFSKNNIEEKVVI